MFKLTLIATIALCALLVLGTRARSESTRDESEAVARTLDALHAAASKADGARYFSLFAPDAVFLGTDATERWTLAEFKAYAQARFEQGAGWTYTLVPGSRHITIAGDAADAGGMGGIAWFDELLDNAKYGRCRGTGVLRKIGGDEGGWKIAQYNLTFTIPNDVATDVAALIKAKPKQD